MIQQPQMRLFGYVIVWVLLVMMSLIRLTSYKSMDWLPMDLLHQRLEWVKQKGTWLLSLLLLATTLAILAFWGAASLFFFLQPEDYRALSRPEFQTQRHDGYKLVAVFENPALKSTLCSQQAITYTGSSIDQEEFCNFNYQSLPPMRHPFDVSILGLQALQVRYVSVCLLKMPRPALAKANQTEEVPQWTARNRYVCQKYRAYQAVRLLSDLKMDELYLMEVQLELSQKGFEGSEFVEATLAFEEDRSKAMRWVVDYYVWIALAVSAGTAVWVGFASTVIGVMVIVQVVVKEKQRKEEQLLENVRSLKRE